MNYPVELKKLPKGITKLLIGLLFLFLSGITTFAQPLHLGTFYKLYHEAQNEKTAINLSKAYQRMAHWYGEMPQYNADSIRYYFKIAEELLATYNSVDEMLEVYRNALNTYNVYTPAQVDSISQRAWKHMAPKFPPTEDHLMYYEILYSWAIASNQLGDRTKSLELYARAYELVKEEARSSIQARLIADRGNMYLSLGDTYESEGYPYIQQSIALYENGNERKELRKIYQNYSHMAWRYNTLDQFDSSLVFFKKEKALLDSITDPMIHFEYYANYGNVLFRMGKKEEAKQNLLLGHELALKYHMVMNAIYRFNLSLLGVAFDDEKMYDKAIDYFKQAHQIYKLMSPKGYDPDNMENIAIAYEKKGDFQQALYYHKLFREEYIKYIESVNSKSVREQELQTDLIVQEKDLERKKSERNFLFIGMVVTFLLSVLLWLLFRRSIKRKKALEEQNKIIEQQANTLRQQDINKMRFFSNVSHELRTPLTLMLGPLTTVLNNEKLDGKSKSLISLARQNAKQLMTLVNEILDITKAESVKMTVNQEPTHIYGFFKRLISNFESYASQRKVKLLFNVDSNLPGSILMDTIKVERIFNNLLSNALKFTPPEGTITVKIADEATQWSLIVTDTGRGIHPDDLPFVFDRFYQGSQLNMSLEGGTGIGLSLSRDLALVMHGDIIAHSKLGEGSVFTLTLPKTEVIGDDNKAGSVHVGPEEEIPQAYSLTHTEEDSVLPVVGQKLKVDLPGILIVEDNLSLREYLTILLSEKYTVTAVMNGNEAISYLTKSSDPKAKPDLIITDIMMPVMDGFILLEKLKSDPSLQTIPVVMLTARIGNEDRLRALRIGVDDYLTKPFEEEELLARIKNLLTNAMMRKQTTKMEEISAGNIPIIQSKEDAEWLVRLENESLLQVANPAFTIDHLADRMHISRAQFFRRVQFLTGMSPLQYIQAIKYNYARSLLEQRIVSSVKAAAAAIGVSKVQYFSEQFKERFGKSPSEYLS